MRSPRLCFVLILLSAVVGIPLSVIAQEKYGPVSAKADSGPQAAVQEIDTNKGPASITRTAFSNRVPPGCSAGGVMCAEAKPGYRFLVVYLAPLANTKKNFWQQKGAFIVDEELERYELSANMGTRVGEEDIYFVAFLVRQASEDFILFWPKNRGVRLSSVPQGSR